MKLKKALIVSLIIFISLFCFINLSQAQGVITGQVDTFGKTVYGVDEAGDPAVTAARIINPILGLLGIIFIVLMLYAGYLYLTSLGKEEQIKKSKQLIVSAIIGVIIIIAAYAITAFVLDAIQQGDQNYTGSGDDAPAETVDE
jgi:uncharacterized membrane protein YwzB